MSIFFSLLGWFLIGVVIGLPVWWAIEHLSLKDPVGRRLDYGILIFCGGVFALLCYIAGWMFLLSAAIGEILTVKFLRDVDKAPSYQEFVKYYRARL